MKIGFVLLSSRASPIPSTRVAVLNMLPRLREAGHEVHVLHEPASPSERPVLQGLDAGEIACQGFDLVCFQKVSGPSVMALVDALRGKGVATAFIVCDVVDNDMARRTDATIVVTDFLKSLHAQDLQHKIHVVHDGIERPEAVKARTRDDRGSRAQPLRAVLVTSAHLNHLPVIQLPPPWLSVRVVGRYPAAAGLLDRARDLQWRLRQHPRWSDRWQDLRFRCHPRVQRVPWHPDAVYAELMDADIGIIPIDTDAREAGRSTVPDWMVKSENRLTLKMAVGLPVIATPIPAYLPVVEQGFTGFLAQTPRDWRDGLEALRDPATRDRMGRAARAAVIHRFGMAAQFDRLQQALAAAVARSSASQHV